MTLWRVSLHRHIPRVIGHGLRPGAPAGVHPVGRTVEHGLDLVNLAALHLEQLGDFPGPGLRGAGSHDAPIRYAECARGAAHMIEEPEREHDSALLVHGDVAP